MVISSFFLLFLRLRFAFHFVLVQTEPLSYRVLNILCLIHDNLLSGYFSLALDCTGLCYFYIS